MSLESAIEGLTAAVKENTAAMRELEAKVDGPAEAKPEKPKKSSAKDKKPEKPKEEPKTEPDAVDKKAVTAKIIQLAKEKGRDAAAKLLAEYDAQKVPELDESVYGEVYAKAEELLS